MQKIDFTIAVMIYNIERFLPMCVDSIIAQNGDDIEILLIDDGSTDSSGKICDDYAKKDSRIRVIHQNNAGVAAARNVAIDEAKGKWLIQVDGDDVLLPNTIEYGREYFNDDSDLLQFDAVDFVDNVSLDAWSPKGEEMVVSGDLLKEYHLQLVDRTNPKIIFPTYNLNPAWSKMWNMDFIRRYDLHYDPKVVKGEGTLFTFTCSYYMKKVRIIPKPIYGYRINPYSIMRRFSADILENQNVQCETYQRVIDEHNENDNEIIKKALSKRGLYLIENAINLGISHPDCPWDNEKCIDWCKTLCSLDWVQQAVKYAKDNDMSNSIFDLIRNNDYIGLAKKCASQKKHEKFKKSKIGQFVKKLYSRIK